MSFFKRLPVSRLYNAAEEKSFRDSWSIVFVTWVYEILEHSADHLRNSSQEKPVGLHSYMACDKSSRNPFEIDMLAESAIEVPLGVW